MKALSLTQPWASLVIEGYKEYETRSWKTPYRGLLAIHASKGFPGCAKAILGDEDYDGDPFFTGALNRPTDELPLGAILGVVTLVDCFPTTAFPLGSEAITDRERAFGDWTATRFAWKLENAIHFQRPITVKGALSLWEVPTDYLWQIDEAIALA